MRPVTIALATSCTLASSSTLNTTGVIQLIHRPVGPGGAPLTAVDSSFIGACLVQMMSPDPDTCRGLDAVYDCARRQCNLDACAAECQDYIACIRAAPDACTAGISCTHGEPCLTCWTN